MKRRLFILQLIVAFKAFKATLLTLLGVGLLVSSRHDPVTTALSFARIVHLPVTSRLFDRLMTLAFNATPTREVGLAVTAFGYAVLMGSEGVALYLRRPWARWFTIMATSSLIPLEVFEIAREVHPIRIVVLVVNIAVVIYLWRRREMFE
ncbi:MAG TPA: DUF2127 domain-containing protein [Vicinamibacterales bacterium]|nr:DUF2127 domain-containing protein [Vicinamibacterales bacterium]